ncbi:MAG: hypothetical protein HC932_00985 [Thermales bacterium]|nr:hypothetical protein [Thermales bacterium]
MKNLLFTSLGLIAVLSPSSALAQYQFQSPAPVQQHAPVQHPTQQVPPVSVPVQPQVIPTPQAVPTTQATGSNCVVFDASQQREKTYFFDEPVTTVASISGTIGDGFIERVGPAGIPVSGEEDPNYKKIDFLPYGFLGMVMDTTHRHFFAGQVGESFKPSKRVLIKLNIKGPFYKKTALSGIYNVCFN